LSKEALKRDTMNGTICHSKSKRKLSITPLTPDRSDQKLKAYGPKEQKFEVLGWETSNREKRK